MSEPGKTSPVLSWKIEKVPGEKVKVFITTKDILEEKDYHKSYLYEYKLAAELREQEPYDQIEVYINSRGGTFKSAMGIFDALKKTKKPIRTLICGQCASAATLFLGLPGEKFITPESDIFVHFGKVEAETETGETIETSDALPVDAAAEILNKVYLREMKKNLQPAVYRWKRKNQTPSLWMADEKRFDAEQAVKEGLVSAVVGKTAFERGRTEVFSRIKREAIYKHVRKLKITGAVAILTVLAILFGGWIAVEKIEENAKFTTGTVVKMEYIPPIEPFGMVNYNEESRSYENGLMRRTAGYLITVRGDNGKEEIFTVSKEKFDSLEIGKRVKINRKGKNK